MKMFMVKSVTLMAILIFAVLYGMMVAKDNMIKMQLINEVQPKSEKVLNFDIKLPAHKQNQPVVKKESIEEKAARLEKIKTFNPYEKVGSSLSSGIQSVFRKGIHATSETVKQAIEAVIKP